jgi:predicted O-linked N-acetylglucosamine transferase (SPINDLY family)
MGVPVVVLSGNRHGARFGKSFLSNLGLAELAAETADQYVNIAVAMAGDQELLLALRQNLRRMMQASPLMDAHGYMRDVEHLYRKILAEIN